MKKFRALIILLILLPTLFIVSCKPKDTGDLIIDEYSVYDKVNNIKVYKDNKYNDYESVSLYLAGFKELPSNYYNREEFAKIRDQFNKENLITCFGGVFQNREKHLPLDDKYYECDVNYNGTSRGKTRLVYNFKYSKIYYTEDHYDSFTLMYNNYKYDGSTLFI